MDHFDLRGAILAHLSTSTTAKLNRRANPPAFRCPRHEDNTPSAWVGDHAWGCHACSFSEPLGTLADILGIERPKRARGLTVEQYAERKGFSVTNLTKWGVHNGTGRFGDPVVMIPYYDAEGKVLREKHRTHRGTFWGTGHGTYLYGLNMLAKCERDVPVILVEGESDCHAGWHAKLLTIGVPGATQWKTAWAPLFEDRTVYIWQEADSAGETMVQKITTDLPHARILIAEPGGAKDLADLFKATGAGFKAAMEARMAAALPVGVKRPAIVFEPLLGGALEELRRHKLGKIDAVPTPYPTWNACCGDEGGAVGLARGWHVTLAGNTGYGKSLVALNLAARAIEVGETVSFVSLEMSWKQLLTRLLAIVSQEQVFRLEQGKYFDVEAHQRAERAIQAVFERTGGSVRTNWNMLSDLPKIEEAIRYEHEYHNARYVIVDYLQLAYVQNTRNDVERITMVSNAIRRLAAELGIVTVGLSQYNRETSKDKTMPPSPQGLYGGSALENDSHQVLLLNHAEFHRDELTNTAKTQLLLAKNRHGAQARIDLLMNYRTLRVDELGTIPSAFAPPVPPAPTAAPTEDIGEAWEDPAQQSDFSFPAPPEEEVPNAA